MHPQVPRVEDISSPFVRPGTPVTILHGGRIPGFPGAFLATRVVPLSPRGSSETRGTRAQCFGSPGHRSHGNVVERRDGPQSSLRLPAAQPISWAAVLIGFVGPGLMGSEMVRNLAAAGHEVRLYARSPERARDLPATLVGSAAEAVDGADLACSCVTDSPDVRAVVEDMLRAAAPAPVIAEMSTIAPGRGPRARRAVRGARGGLPRLPGERRDGRRGGGHARDHVRRRRRGARARGRPPSTRSATRPSGSTAARSASGSWPSS